MAAESTRNGARLFVGENAIEDERLNVAVENYSNELVVLVHNRTSAVAANNVGVGNEIKFRGEIERDFLSTQRCGKSNGGWFSCSVAR